jgi:heat shock protein HslJ
MSTLRPRLPRREDSLRVDHTASRRASRRPTRRASRRAALPVATLLAMALTACGSATQDPSPGGPVADPPAGPADELAGRSFVSTSIVDGATRPLEPGTVLTLSFREGGVGARAGCNHMFADGQVEGGRFMVDGPVGGTEMGCGDRQHHDRWVTDLLTGEPEVMLDGDRLTLTSGGTEVELIDQESAEPSRPLTGTAWRLESIEEGGGADGSVSSVPTGVTSTLRFDDDGALAARPGCNSGSAAYAVAGDRLRVEPMTLTRMACDPPAMDVESTVVGVLDGDVRFSVDGGTLRLERGGRALVYRAS